MTRGRVVVIGGGLAGVSAAFGCRDAGFDVTLLEARSRLGGATYSFSRGELTVDTGQHVFLRCYTEYLALLRRLGTLDRVRIQPRFRVPVITPHGPGWTLRRAELPAPGHLLPALWGHRALSPRQRLTAARTALALRGLDPDDPALDRTDFGSWLRSRGESDRSVATLWGLFCVAALNSQPDEASLAQAVKVFRTGMLDTTTGGDIGVIRRPLSEVHGDPAQRKLSEAGVLPLTRHKALEISGEPCEYRVRVSAEQEYELTADAVVLAVPHPAAAKLLADRTSPVGVDLTELSRAPIVNVHAHFDRRVTDLSMAAALDSPVQWLFDRTEAADAPRGQYLAISLSAAHEEVKARSARLREQYLPELRRLFPAAREARLLDFFVTREPAATFRPVPGARSSRPAARTAERGLVLAGAWTDTGWPDTLEGAVRSGNTAASVVSGTVDRHSDVAWR
ncbi:squalene-associated FAD-dependent desaturase [Actinopolyspora lacussalsi subsp. righensis]|uniref:Squalene-associated FAD-dependent desaturase n=1 Tax=Actinopolyspora righensis TaxID=995060 RepID=A0A1I7BIB1_9ACTN|nr:hydroxysqualene dehydroxylase HpnE [Actinopolyspora righensis]SFT86914.1 squalene-associated FAD-dependent desaturase [Actinopolyspora righensis]